MNYNIQFIIKIILKSLLIGFIIFVVFNLFIFLLPIFIFLVLIYYIYIFLKKRKQNIQKNRDSLKNKIFDAEIIKERFDK